jgi:hypothetical protein
LKGRGVFVLASSLPVIIITTFAQDRFYSGMILAKLFEIDNQIILNVNEGLVWINRFLLLEERDL